MRRCNATSLKDELGFDAWHARKRLVTLMGNGKGKHVLDVGTGCGSMAIALAQHALAVTSVDKDRETLACAKDQAVKLGKNVLKRIRFEHADATRLPFRSSTFDGVFSFCALHHMSDYASAIEEMLRVSKPEGVVVIAELNRNGSRAVGEAMGRSDIRSVRFHTRWRANVIAKAFRKRKLHFRWYRREFVTVFIASARVESRVAKREHRGGHHP